MLWENFPKERSRTMRTYAYGFPRLGENREYKKAIEDYWANKVGEEQLQNQLYKLEEQRLNIYEKYVDKFPVGEMTFYDNMLDTALMLGLYKVKNLREYYYLCRGRRALKLTKWFNTNYHYVVPEFDNSFSPSRFNLLWNKPEQYKRMFEKEIPYLIGPFTFLKLSKGINQKDFPDYLFALVDVYVGLIKDFKEVHIEEPAFVMDISDEEVKWIREVYKKIGSQNCDIYLFSYYDSVSFLPQLFDLPVKGIGLDFVSNEENLANIKKYGFPSEKVLIAGIVDGRNIWKTDIKEVIELLKGLSKYADNLVISNSCPLYHLPITVKSEALDERLKRKIAFAVERLEELNLIARIYEGKSKYPYLEKEDKISFANPEVRQRIENLKEEKFKRALPYSQRVKIQGEILNPPVLPVTTIGSFPQTQDVRKKRADFKAGRISGESYERFIREKIKEVVKIQEDLGLDVLVHGEFERTDMVEFFAQKLDGIVTTKNGWILSYGTRIYRPPIIYGDISRPFPMTIREIGFAQSLTEKPVKGMLTGPVTIIAWSYVRNDIPIQEVAYQISLSLQDEIKDYENAGIKIVQIDEPAFREKAPLKKKNWDRYFEWAVKAFNLVISQSKPETQIHTHMCYSEFGEIIKYISKMDFDVITIESARSKGEIVKYFQNVDFERQIGLGVWDVHSPRVPTVAEMEYIIENALKFFPKENLWINPDCGLKTRKWEEVLPSLKNLVKLAEKMRRK